MSVPIMGSRTLRAAAVILVLMGFGTLATGRARASGSVTPAYAAIDTPGPPLSVPTATLSQALSCHGSLQHSAKPPILLVPGTTLNPSEFAWNWEPALAEQSWPYCTIDLPGNAMGDIQIAGEYVVYAIRTMYQEAGERIDVVGHSQGGMVPRWALRFWPDTRAMVDDVIGLSPSNHGTVDADAVCAVGCAPAFWQQQDDAHFIAALNSDQETFPGISYTDIHTDTDEVVVPNIGPDASSALHGGGGLITNVTIQQVCPLDPTEHIGIGTYDNTAYQIAMDALTHPGPADPSRVSASVCDDLLMPGVDPSTFATSFAQTLGVVATTLATYPHVSAEPALACYVTASCTGAAAATLGLRTTDAGGTTDRTRLITATVTAREGTRAVPVQGAIVRIDGVSATTSAAGRATLRPRLAGARKYAVTATMAGCNPARGSVTGAAR